jgi:hypothetical protein
MSKYSKKAQDKIEMVMDEFKHGKLKSGKLDTWLLFVTM